MRRSLLFGLGAASLAAAQQSVSVFTVVVPGLSTDTGVGHALSTKIDTVTWVNNVTTTTVYVCPSGSKSGSTPSSMFIGSASEAESSATPSTTVATINTTTSQPAALPTAAGEHINFEGSMMGLVVFCALGLLIL